jgi:transcriptional regulator GlxA family with amidase domain
MTARNIAIVVFPGVQSLDVTGPFEVFSGAGRAALHRGHPLPYDVAVVAHRPGPVTTSSGLCLQASGLPGPRTDIDTLVLAGGEGVDGACRTPELVAFVQAAAERARRVATVCSGALLAAEAGLLDGRRATTHWARAEELARRFPAVEVDADPIYLRDGRVWTSAGVTAGIDLALALVEEDLGTEVAQTVARWLVMFLHRPGGQTQFATPVWTRRAERSPVRAAQSLVETAPGDDHRVATLARSAAMSERHFTRVFTAEVGETPSRYVERVRTEAARRDLESTDDTLDVIAARCGFGTAETLRRTFHRRLRTSPDAYRRRFAAPRSTFHQPPGSLT